MSRVPDPALLADLEKDLAERYILYFYARPSRPDRPLNPKSRLLGLYDPFARRDEFPAGRRLCCNVYAGCGHRCAYCYTLGFIRDARTARAKAGLPTDLRRDLADLRALQLPPMPLHLSNSTDPLQEELETRYGHTLHLLQELVREQGLFSSIIILTKNPERLTLREYLSCLRQLDSVCVEVSLTFWDDTHREITEPGAPSVENRLNTIRYLREEGVPVSLRIDPLFPRNPLPSEFFSQRKVENYGASSAHSFEDIQELIRFASETGCRRVIVSPLKVTAGRRHDPDFVSTWYPLYSDANGGKPIFKGSAYRLPPAYINEHLIGPVVAFGREIGIEIIHCKANLISTP